MATPKRPVKRYCNILGQNFRFESLELYLARNSFGTSFVLGGEVETPKRLIKRHYNIFQIIIEKSETL